MLEFGLIEQYMGNLEEEELIDALKQVNNTEDAQNAMAACQKGLEIVGTSFETGEFFVGDLVFAGEMMQEAVNMLKPYLAEESTHTIGKMVFCTVKNDLHDIGKNIVKALLEANGLEVIDLGVDVPAETIVKTVKENNLKIVALSGVLTMAIDSMKMVVDALAEAGLRDSVKVIIGGAPVTAEANEIIGADAWTKNPQDTVRICLEWAKAV